MYREPYGSLARDPGVAVRRVAYGAGPDRWADLRVPGGPGTFDDAAAGIDALATVDAGLDPGRVVAVGHSAGGHLALWLAARPGLPPGAPGVGPGVVPGAVVGLAAVSDLAGSSALGLDGDAADRVPVGMSRDLAEAARAAGDEVDLAVVRGAGHAEMIDPESPPWEVVTRWLDGLHLPASM